jgi:hypothetical protein
MEPESNADEVRYVGIKDGKNILLPKKMPKGMLSRPDSSTPMCM